MNIIVMMDKNGCIGIEGDQPIHLKNDLNRFKELTDKKIVVYGYNTLQTFPNKQPLPNRRNIVITNTHKEELSTYNYDSIEIISSVDEFINFKQFQFNTNDICIIGGASVYKQLLPYVNRVYITLVDTNFISDPSCQQVVYFPDIDFNDGWHICTEISQIDTDSSTGKTYNVDFIEYRRN